MTMLDKDTALAFCKDFYRCHKQLNTKVHISGPYVSNSLVCIDLFDASLTLMKDREGKIVVTYNDQILLNSNEHRIIKDIYNSCVHPNWYTPNRDEFNYTNEMDWLTKENILTNMVYNYPNRDFDFIKLSYNKYEIFVVNQPFLFIKKREQTKRVKYYFQDYYDSDQNFFYSPAILSKIWEDLENQESNLAKKTHDIMK